MIDLIMTDPTEGPAGLFTRNFRVHAGIPIGLYTDGPRSPVALLYGDVSPAMLTEMSQHYRAIIAIPSMKKDAVPEHPCHYETMTVKAPILATMHNIRREGFADFVNTFEGGPLVLHGDVGGAIVLLFTADLIKATIRILSGEIEQHTGRDRYNRHIPPPESITYAPGVSLHFNLIENAIRFVCRAIGEPLIFLPRWPESSPLAIFLSHDVDVVRKWTFKRSLYEVGKGFGALMSFRAEPLRHAIASITRALQGRDPYWSFDDILFMEHGNGFKATWFFAPFGGKYNRRENEYDPVYHRKASDITAMIRRIMENDCELALHGTRSAFTDVKALRNQLISFEDRLGFPLKGVRHHYLMFRHGETLEAAAKAELMYDATLGFSDRPGFRNGMAAPFFPYPVDHPAGSLVEIPLNFMDTLFVNSGKDAEAMKRRVTEAYLYAKAAGGLFSTLIHPSNMPADEMPGLEQFYQSLLLRFRMDGGYSLTGTELAEWWNKREEVLRAIEYGPGMWRIKDVDIPENMNLAITAPDMRSRRFMIEGANGQSSVENDILTIRPGAVDPKQGITVIQKR